MALIAVASVFDQPASAIHRLLILSRRRSFPAYSPHRKPPRNRPSRTVRAKLQETKMTMRFNVRATALPLFAIAAMVVTVPAHAQSDDGFAVAGMGMSHLALTQSSDGPRSVAVGYDDLDVGQAADAKVLLQRIEAASVQVCGGLPDPRDLAWRAEFDECRALAVNEAVRSVNSPLLASLSGQTQTSVRVAGR
jgi:UrcA family protein